MNPAGPTIAMYPGPGVSGYVSVPGGGYVVSPGRAAQVQPEHVEALLAAGWSMPTPPPQTNSAPNPALYDPHFRQLTQPRLMVRMFPPPGGALRRMTVEGRLYEVPEGENFLDVPIEDARVLAYNGWFDLGPVGPTEARPAAPLRGYMFTDTTVGLVMIFDGQAWRDFLTGESF